MDRMVRDERGVALVTALIALVIVSLLGAAALTLAGGTINQTIWDRSSGQAFHIAEAGFNQAVARIKSGAVTVGTFNTKFSAGEASVTVTKLNDYAYQVKSVGAQPSFAQPQARRAVQGIITYIDSASVAFADGSQGQVVGNATIDGPFFMRDELNPSGNAFFYGGPFFIKDDASTLNPTGDLVLGGSSQMGTAAEPIILFVDGNQPYAKTGPKLYASAVYTDVPDLQMPIVDADAMPAKRAEADTLVIDDNDVLDGARPVLSFTGSESNITTGSYPGGPYLIWTGGTTDTLEIKGKVFLDGPLTVGGITYAGRGTITANGVINVTGNFQPKPVSAVGVAPTTFPDTDVFGLVTPKNMSIDTNGKVVGMLYAYGTLYMKKVDFWGSAQTRTLNLQTNPYLHIPAGLNQSNLPPGIPQMAPMTAISGWQEVQP